MNDNSVYRSAIIITESERKQVPRLAQSMCIFHRSIFLRRIVFQIKTTKCELILELATYPPVLYLTNSRSSDWLALGRVEKSNEETIRRH